MVTKKRNNTWMEAFLDVSSRSFFDQIIPRVTKLMKLPSNSYLPLYSPIIRHLGNTDRHRTRKGQKKRKSKRERLRDFFLRRRKLVAIGRMIVSLALASVIKANFNYSRSPFKTFVYPRRVKLSVKSVISRRHF